MRKISWVVAELRAEWRAMTRWQRVVEFGRWIVLFVFAFCVFTMTGCTTLTEYEKADRDILTREAYYRCQAAVLASGRYWQTKGTRSAMDVKLKREPDPLTMRVEMMQNGCRR